MQPRMRVQLQLQPQGKVKWSGLYVTDMAGRFVGEGRRVVGREVGG